METVTMNWGQAITIILAILSPMFGFFIWLRKDLKDEIKEFRNEMKSDLREIKADLVIIRDRTSRLEAQEDYSRASIIELWKIQGRKKEGE